MHLEPGSIFARDFRVIRPLSQGGMGTIYVVEQLSTGRQRALKLMLPELVQNANLRQRFDQEARVAARIESDHIVQVIAAGIDDASGCPWLAMELLKGQTLDARVHERGLLSPPEIVSIVTQLCHGLRAAHAVTVVHRDLKPENIFLADVAREGGGSTVKILDFGIARISAEAKSTKTAAVGTPLWMAPEQAKVGSSISPATDLWALGLIAFWMITGKEYWLSAQSPDQTPLMLMNEVLLQPMEPASQRAAALGGRPVPPGFDAWLARTVNRDIGARFPDVDSALAALLPLLAQMPSEPASGSRAARPSGTLIGAPLDPSHGFGQGATFTPMPSGPGDYRASAPSAPPGQTILGHQHVSDPGPATQRDWAPAPSVSSPMFHVPTGAPLTTSAPHGPPLPPPSKAPLIAGLALGAIVLLGGGGYALTHLGPTHRSGDKSSSECTASDLDACEAACDAAREKDDADLGACDTYAHALLDKDKVDKALPVLERSCDQHPGAACDVAGGLLAFSSKAAHDDKKAASLFQRACDKDVASACAHLGAATELGWADGGAKKALSLYEKACDAGDGHGCVYQAIALAAGRGAKPDAAKVTALRSKAKDDLEKRCRGGDAEACSLQGVVIETSGDALGARDSYRKGCDAGDLLGCNNLARLSAEGVGGPPDAPGALKRFRELCDQGDAAACDDAGVLESKLNAQLRFGPRGEATYKFRCAQAMNTGCAGWGDDKVIAGGSGDLAKAVESFTRACDGGSLTACVNLGGLTIIGQGTRKDRPRAHELFNKACTRGEPTACGEEGSLFFSDYLEQPADPAKGFSLLTAACDGGELDSCSLVLNGKSTGYGTQKALPDALAGLRALCEEKKISQSCVSYGQALITDANDKRAASPTADVQAELDQAKKLYADACDKAGDGCAALADAFLRSDPAAQLAAYTKGCDKGQLEACCDLSRAYQDGVGTDKDAKKAFELAKKACDRGYSAGCGRLGVFYLEGAPDVPQDAKKGAALLKEACDDGDVLACGNYGECLVTGAGVDKSPSSAAPYLKKGCNAGFKNACDRLKEVGP